MGLVGVLFPFSDAIKPTHEGAFLWSNISSILAIIALINWIFGWLSFGIWFFIWIFFDLAYLVTQIVGSILHILACKDDEGIGSAFTTFGISATAVGVLNLYSMIIHVISWILVFFLVGLFTVVICYIISIVHLVIAFLHAKNEA